MPLGTPADSVCLCRASGYGNRMLLPPAIGPVSRLVAHAISRPDAIGYDELVLGPDPVLHDRDTQLALWMLYELHYRGFDDVPDDREWEPGLLALRRTIERAFEAELRAAADALLDRLDRVDRVADQDDVAEQVLALVESDDSPSIAAYLQRHATLDELTDYVREHSVSQLKESDPQAFLVPRLTGRAKVALAEVQYDEFGGGRPERLHQDLYARAMRALGLDDTYGAYVAEVGATALAGANAMSLFALHRRLRGAAAGHFAAFEASSSVPCRKIVAGIERLGLPDAVAADVIAYFDEHVEADAVHEQVVSRDLCGSLVAEAPSLRADVLFGAAACLLLQGQAAAELLGRWQAGVSAA